MNKERVCIVCERERDREMELKRLRWKGFAWDDLRKSTKLARVQKRFSFYQSYFVRRQRCNVVRSYATKQKLKKTQHGIFHNVVCTTLSVVSRSTVFDLSSNSEHSNWFSSQLIGVAVCRFFSCSFLFFLSRSRVDLMWTITWTWCNQSGSIIFCFCRCVLVFHVSIYLMILFVCPRINEYDVFIQNILEKLAKNREKKVIYSKSKSAVCIWKIHFILEGKNFISMLRKKRRQSSFIIWQSFIVWRILLARVRVAREILPKQVTW